MSVNRQWSLHVSHLLNPGRLFILCMIISDASPGTVFFIRTSIWLGILYLNLVVSRLMSFTC